MSTKTPAMISLGEFLAFAFILLDLTVRLHLPSLLSLLIEHVSSLHTLYVAIPVPMLVCMLFVAQSH